MSVEKNTDLVSSEQNRQNEILDKQIELISQASEMCAENTALIQYLPALSQALNATITAKDIHNGKMGYTYGFATSNVE